MTAENHLSEAQTEAHTADTHTADTHTAPHELTAEAIVRVEGLTRTYQQGQTEVHALQGVNLAIKAGEFTALMGPSGSGKSTLLNLIGALDAPTSGALWLRGQNLAELSASERAALRRDHIGFVFQAYNLLPILSAYEYAEMVLIARGVPEVERRREVMEVLEAVGLKGLESRRPSELSGGQQQRVAVARAIAGSPTLILADEPTANLDSQTGAELIELMRSLNEERGVTFVFATHDPQVMRAACRVVRLVDGQVDSDEHR